MSQIYHVDTRQPLPNPNPSCSFLSLLAICSALKRPKNDYGQDRTGSDYKKSQKASAYCVAVQDHELIAAHVY